MIEKEIVKKKISDGDPFTCFHIGCFSLGLTIIGIILAYVLPAADDDTKRNRVHWAWRGALTMVTVVTTLVLARANSGF